MIELIDKRKPNEKHFLKDNGNIEVQLFREKVHYLKNGKYEEISNELKETNNSFENEENDYKVIFNKTNSGIKYVKGDYYLEIIPKCTHIKEYEIEKNTKNISKILYKNIFANIDLEYVLSFSGVKENLIVKDKIENEKVEYEIKSNLEINVENNSLFCKNERETVFTFIVPYMKDSDGAECSNVSYKIENDILTLSFDKEWINENNRKYPVIIDPSLENNDKGVNDTYIYPGDTNDVRYNKDYLKAGVEKVNNQDRVNRSLLKFVLPEIGTSDEVIRATLNLYGYMAVEEARELTEDEASQNTDKLVTIHEVTKDWTLSEANWNNMNNAYNSSVENVAYISRSYLEYDLSVVPAELRPVIRSSFNDCLITSLVKRWLNGSPNYGIMIKQAKEEYINTMIPMFFSSNFGEGDLAPLLTIEYRNQNGLESYLDYMSQSFSNGTAYVNTFNGNLTTLFSLSNTIGVFPASVGIVYNTNDVITNNSSIYGKGYRLTYDETIEKVPIGNDEKLKYVDGDGTIHYFYLLETKYKDEDGLNFEIELFDTTCTMKDKNGNSTIFTKNGNIYYLSKIKNISNQEINITRNVNNNITKILDFNNNEINISYETNKISFISPSETTILNYENNNLKTIVTKEGTTTFDYDTNNIITKITDVTGLSIVYDYYSGNSKKVKKVTQYGLNNKEGQSFTLDYQLFSTKIVDNKNKITNNIYNYYGNLISSNSMADGVNINDAYSITRTYGNESENKNKILSNTIPIKFSKNMCGLTNYANLDGYTVFSNNMGMSDHYDETFNGVSLVEFASDNIIQNSLTGFSLDEITDYTVSLYVKTTLSAKIRFYLFDTNETVYEKEFKKNDDYEKIVFTFNRSVDTDLMMRIIHEEPCATYIGDIKIEKGVIENDYNIIENPDFKKETSNWNLTASALDTEVEPNVSDVFEVVNIDSNGNKALKVNMQSYNMSDVVKEIEVKGKKDDLYYLGFWYKNNGVETGIDPTTGYDPSGSIVGNTVSVYFKPVDGEIEQCVPAYPLYSNKDNWQYFYALFAPIKDYNKIIIRLHQGRDQGDLYLTNFSLFKKIKTNRYEYDEYGNITQVKDIKESDVFNYDKNNELISATNPRGKNYKVEYDNNITDRVIRAISSTGISNKVVYDDFGNPIQTKISKDYSEEITTGYYKIRQKGTNKYLKIQDNNLTLKYDYCSNTTFKVEKIDDSYKISDAVIANKYLVELNNKIILDTLGNCLFKIEQNQNASYHIYILDDKDNKKYLKWVDNTFEFVSDYSDIEENYLYEFYFEDASRLFIQQEAMYSSDGRFVESVKDSLLNEIKYTRNKTKGLVEKKTNAKGIETSYLYNDKNQITKIKQGNKEIQYNYNSQNQLSEIIQGNKTYKFTYDEFLHKNNIKINNRNLITYTYEENNGNLLSSTYGNNSVINFQYDEFDRVKKVKKDNNEYEYLYNNNGDIHRLSENDGESFFLYDEDKRLKKYTDTRYYTITYEDEENNIVTDRKNNNFNIEYYYDNDNNITKQKLSLDNESHIIENIFNKDGMVLESNLDSTKIKYTYDELLRVTNKNINNNYETKYEYLSIGNRTSAIIKSITNGNKKYSYKYDKLYNITDIYLNNNLINHYEYDDYNELISDEDYVNNIKTEYTYDNEGNILTKVKKNISTNESITTDTYEYNDSSWEDLLTKYNDELITYDEIGNPLTIGSKKLTWINGRQLNTYKDSNISVSYKYNINGIRTKKTINGVDTDYFIENNLIIYEKTGGNIIYYLYDDGDIIGLKYNNMVYYYLKNIQGDIVGIIDSNYQIVARYEYDSMGTILSIKNSCGQEITNPSNVAIVNPFRYRGYYYDKETELYYLNSRYYNPMWGRFLNADGLIYLEQSIMVCNLFAYTANNFINHSDKNGKWFLLDFLEGLLEEAVNFVESTFDYSANKYGVKNVEPPIKNKKRKAAKPSPTYYSINKIIDNSKLTCNVGASYSSGKTYASVNYTREIAPNSNINKSSVSFGAGITESASIFGPLSLNASFKFETKIRDLTDLVYPRYYSPYTSSISGGFNGLNYNFYAPVYSNNGQMNFNTAVGFDYGVEYTIEWDE